MAITQKNQFGEHRNSTPFRYIFVSTFRTVKRCNNATLHKKMHTRKNTGFTRIRTYTCLQDFSNRRTPELIRQQSIRMEIDMATFSENSVSTSHQDQMKCLLKGIDSLYVSYFLDLQSSDLDFDKLSIAKERLKADGEQFRQIELGSETFALKPWGKIKYAYVMSNAHFEVCVTERMQPTCHIQFSSKGLWCEGLQNLLDRVDRWQQSMRMTKMRMEVVSRADFAFDFHISEIDFDEDSFVSRATKDTKWRENQKAQTFQFGTGAVVLRVYDKSAEIREQSQKTWFHEFWGRSEDIWRVEFQVRSERLASGGIKTLADLWDHQSDLLTQLAIGHTSLRLPTNDQNRSRWPLHPLWQELLREIDRLPQMGLVRAFDPLNEIEYRLYCQFKSLYGSLKGIGALLQVRDQADEPPELCDLLRRLERLLDKHHSPSIWRDEIKRRVTAHALGQW